MHRQQCSLALVGPPQECTLALLTSKNNCGLVVPSTSVLGTVMWCELLLHSCVNVRRVLHCKLDRMLISRMLALDTRVSDHVVMVMFAYQSGSSLLKSC